MPAAAVARPPGRARGTKARYSGALTPWETMTPTTPFDPVSAGATPDGLRRICDDHLANARAILDEIRARAGAPPSTLTYATTLGRFDDAVAEIADAQQFPYLMAVAHPDKAARDAAKECEPKVEQVTTALYLDAGVASVLKAYAAQGGEKLTGERAKLLHDTLRDFRRNGLELPPEKQATLRALNKEITELGQRFEQNIAGSTGKLSLAPSQLEGLPPEYVAKHPVKDGKVEVTTDYPDFFPFVTYAKDRKAALDLYVLFTNRGGDGNVAILERLIELRSRKAALLGYATWADYQTETRMAKTSATVKDFLAHVRDAVKEPAQAEYAEFAEEHIALGGNAADAIPPSDRYYLEDRLRNKKYEFDAKELASYFEVTAVTKGLLDVTASMYELEYKPVAANAWHPDVSAYEVYSGGKMIGKFYLDLYPRADKFKHAAMFPIRVGKRLANGEYQLPTAVLECNFARPAGEGGPMGRPPRADGARRRRHLLPRVRPRASSRAHPVRARAVLRDEHGAGLRRGAVADVRGVGVRPRRARSVRAPPRDRSEDPRRALRRAPAIARVRAGARDAAAALPRLARHGVPRARRRSGGDEARYDEGAGRGAEGE